MKRLDPNRNNLQAENEDLKAGSPPRPATEPPGAEKSSHTNKTMTDPSTGEPNRGRPLDKRKG